MRKIAALVLAALAAGSAAAAEPKHSLGSRFYAGMTVATLKLDDDYEGIKLDDSSTGYGIYGGFRLKERLALELSYDAFDAAIDLHDMHYHIFGCGKSCRRFRNHIGGYSSEIRQGRGCCSATGPIHSRSCAGHNS